MSARDIATRICLGVFWLAQTGGVVILYLFLVGEDSDTEQTAVLIPSILVTIALVGRWALIPRFTSLPPLIVTYIVGVVIATSAGVISIFHGGKFISEVVYVVIATMLTYLPVFRLPPEKPNQAPQTTSAASQPPPLS